VVVELAHRCFFCHDRQTPTIDSRNNPRHCEARSAVAIQTALQVALSFWVRNRRMDCHGATRLAMTRVWNYGMVVGLALRFVLRNNNRMGKNEKALATRGRRCEGWEEKRGSEKGRF
jgi:hypothetical protein